MINIIITSISYVCMHIKEGKTAFLIVCSKENVNLERVRKMIERGANLVHMDNVR